MATLLVDTREKKWDHVRGGFDRLGVVYDRSKLYVGDYAWADRQNVVVDRKQGLQEVYTNLIQQHSRFKDECQRAKEAGIKLIVLVEEENIKSVEDVPHWTNPRATNWYILHNAHQNGHLLYRDIPTRPPVPSSTLAAIMRSMADKYGIEWRFCKKADVSSAILEAIG